MQIEKDIKERKGLDKKRPFFLCARHGNDLGVVVEVHCGYTSANH
jgi:hypothetical protein